MWFAHIDESFNDAQHWVGAVLVKHTRVNEAQRAIRTVVADAAGTYGISADTELHGHRIFHGEGDFAPMKQLVRARIGIYASVFDCLVDAGCWIILRAVSKPHLVNRYAYPEHPHRVAMTHLIERVDEFASGRGDHALLIADQHHETESTLFRDLIAYQELGTWGYRGHRIGQVVDTIHFVRSATNWLVQGADMVESPASVVLVPLDAQRAPLSGTLRLAGLPKHARTSTIVPASVGTAQRPYLIEPIERCRNSRQIVRTRCEHQPVHTRPSAGHSPVSDPFGLRRFRGRGDPAVPALPAPVPGW